MISFGLATEKTQFQSSEDSKRIIMQFIVVLLIITLSYVSGEEADCHLTQIQQIDNPYMNVSFDQQTMVSDGIEIRKTLTDRDNITMKIGIFNNGDWERIWLYPCEEKKSTKVENLMHTLEQALGIDITICPLEQQTSKSEGLNCYVCEYEWADNEHVVLLVNYEAYKNEAYKDPERLFKITFWMVRRGDYGYED